MDEIAEIVRAIGRQQGQNDLVVETSNQLLCLYHASNPFVSSDETESADDIAIKLRNTTQELLDKIQKAESDWENFCLD
ncbi:hypothetical protein BDV40DRAFT_306839 [Aspergillus tamarii]|uniref:Uncharacterized protein n=1 Tax=Aspergillus tamarii TaxID=41984 RepID=A0A5N6UBJ6_ASPTM|nr:hypothetical protein BDV40DRAFT_306839 [Aspergillus tamarii]